MTPRQAMRATGHGPVWVSRQTGIERTRLDRLCKGWYAWTPEQRKAFALAVGLSEDAICFVSDAPSEPPVARDAPSESPTTREAVEEALA